jgi:hypothetical protein
MDNMDHDISGIPGYRIIRIRQLEDNPTKAIAEIESMFKDVVIDDLAIGCTSISTCAISSATISKEHL